MKATELKLWRDRLEHSNQVWTENGTTLEESASSDLVWLNAFRGIQWSGPWGGIAEQDLATVNVTFSNTRAMISQISARNPKAVVRPRGMAVERAIGARINELVLQYFIEELRMKREADRALRDALLCRGGGFMRHGFTPAREVYDQKGHRIPANAQERPDLPWMRRIAEWDIRIDPLAETFANDGDAKWCAFRDLMTLDQIRRNPGMIQRDDLRPTVSYERSQQVRRRTRRGRNPVQEGPDFLQMVEVWSVFDHVERMWFQMSPGSRFTLREPADWPEWLENLPYSHLVFNDQADTPFQVAFPEVYASQQRELNKVRTLMVELVKRMRRIILFRDQAFAEEEQAKLTTDPDLVEFFKVIGADALPNVVHAINTGTFPQELILLDRLIKEDIRETIGLSQLDRAQRINVESATEAQGVLQGSAVQRGIDVERFEMFWADILRQFHKALQGTLAQEITVQVVGEADARTLRELEGAGRLEPGQSMLVVRPEDIKGEYRYQIHAQSTVPQDHNAAFAKIIGLMQALAANSVQVDQSELVRLLIEEAGFDSTKLLLSGEEQQATMQQLMGQGGGEGGARRGNGRAGTVDPNLVRAMSSRGAMR